MDISHLTDLCKRLFTENSDSCQALPGLSLYRRDAISDIEAVVYEPVACLILQGSKVTSIGDQSVELKPGDALLVSHHLPVISRITRASVDEPYLALIFALDLGLLRSLCDLVADALLPAADVCSLSAGPADPEWLAPLARYIELMDNPLDARVLGPSVRREIHFRLLLCPIGKMLRHLLDTDSRASRVTKSIQMLCAEFRNPLRVPDLARTAGMSVSSFHEHFKSVTGTTPLRYQKDLRLIEARALLVTRQQTVSQAAYAVGYESPTHFSRDYRRKFGLPPRRDAAGSISASRETAPL